MKKCILCSKNIKNEEMICIDCSRSLSPMMRAVRDIENLPSMQAVRNMENSPMMQAVRNMENSPMMQAVRNMENSPMMQAVRNMENSPMMQAVRDMENSAAWRMIHDLENSAAFKAIREIQNISTFLAIKELEKLPSIKAFSRVADQLKHEYGALALSEAYDLLLDEITEVKNDDNWESFSEKVKDRASRTPETRLSAEFYLALIFSFILYLLSQKSAIESETRISERINDLEQTITTQFDILQSNNANYVFSVTDRELNLRAGPSVDHKVIEVLPKNKKVVELERNRDWVKIEFFDYLANLSRVGWVHSRYLLIVDSKSEE